jgi:hypothetical protein
VSLERAPLDFPANSLPMSLQRVVALQHHLESEPLGGVANLFFAQHVDAPLDFLVGHRRFELLNAHEILIVQRAKPVDRYLKFSDQSFKLRRVHERSPTTAAA